MSESSQAVLVLILIVASFAAAIGWIDDQPSTMMWSIRIIAPIMAILSVGIFLKYYFRKDIAHDYLREQVGTYFNRDGFCFSFAITAIEGVAYMDAYFENQHNTPCLGRIALRPARGFFMGRAEIAMISYEIDCAPAAFGMARIAIPISRALQGKRQSFEVGASVNYPQGKGKRLRFHNGIHLRTNSNFGNAFGTALTIAGAAGGTLVLSKPATVTLDLPIGVSEDMTAQTSPEVRTVWKLGDPPLESEG